MVGSRGRKKVELKKMENETNLKTTFSKRKTSLFNKASELVSRCGADVGLVVVSPTGKTYSFGQTSGDIGVMFDRITSPNYVPEDSSNDPNPTAERLSQELSDVLEAKHIAEKKRKKLKEMVKTQTDWLENSANLTEVLEFQEKLQALKKEVEEAKAEKGISESNNNPEP